MFALNGVVKFYGTLGEQRGEKAVCETVIRSTLTLFLIEYLRGQQNK